MMKKILAIFFVLCLTAQLFVAPVTAGFMYDINILSREEIQKLSDAQLEDAYIDAKIEDKTSQEFHVAAGFSSAKDYENRKKLIRYIFELRREMGRRENLKVDQIDGYLE